MSTYKEMQCLSIIPYWDYLKVNYFVRINFNLGLGVSHQQL